ncbi:MAG: cell wall hydrolase [Clostridia bacterium]|nr:cell wall hydrolase [Clostridia bacterium]
MKLITALLSLLIALQVPTAKVNAAEVSFDTPITLTINEMLIKTDTEPFLYEGNTYVPIRFVSEALSADSVQWDGTREMATIQYEGKKIELPKDKKVAYINGKKITLAGGTKLVNDRVYVPVRFVAEEMDCTVDWIFNTYTVDISKENVTVPPELVAERSYTDDDIYWLSKIIHAESRGEPLRGKIAVGNVVLNRVKSSEYPNTIYGVIFDRQHGVQFSPVLDGSIYQSPLGDSVIAAKRALNGEKEVGACLFFLNPKTAQSSWIITNRPYFKTIHNHDFYL